MPAYDKRSILRFRRRLVQQRWHRGWQISFDVFDQVILSHPDGTWADIVADPDPDMKDPKSGPNTLFLGIEDDQGAQGRYFPVVWSGDLERDTETWQRHLDSQWRRLVGLAQRRSVAARLASLAANLRA